jgi:hypothetical protein
MKNRRAMLSDTLILGLTVAAAAAAQTTPPGGVKAGHHQDLAAAQKLIEEAYQKITAAQEANHSDLGSHAKKAKELLDQANHELGLAADFANQNHH